MLLLRRGATLDFPALRAFASHSLTSPRRGVLFSLSVDRIIQRIEESFDKLRKQNCRFDEMTWLSTFKAVISWVKIKYFFDERLFAPADSKCVGLSKSFCGTKRTRPVNAYHRALLNRTIFVLSVVVRQVDRYKVNGTIPLFGSHGSLIVKYVPRI